MIPFPRFTPFPHVALVLDQPDNQMHQTNQANQKLFAPFMHFPLAMENNISNASNTTPQMP
jgi:hypothetical protein